MHQFLKFILGMKLYMFRTVPKHVEFHSENKFEKLVHLVGFIIRNITQCVVTCMSNSLKKEYSYTSNPHLGLHGLF
jgi:hypothetical protein